MSRRLELAGKVFGRLTVLGLHEIRNAATWWECRCACGKTTVKKGANIKIGHVQSCGCFEVDTRNAHISRNRTHGLSKTCREYKVWLRMRARCNDPNDNDYSLYGGRGIRVCSRWDSFENFYADMGDRPSPKHSLDRRNSNKNYTPKNCRWATTREQSLNRRVTIMVTYNGKKLPLKIWSEQLGIPYGTLYERMHKGRFGVASRLYD